MLDQLPPHLISKILKFLSIQDLARVCLTNVTLKALAVVLVENEEAKMILFVALKFDGAFRLAEALFEL